MIYSGIQFFVSHYKYNYVYKNIIEELNRNACYFGSGKLLGEEYVEKIKDFMEKEYK